MTSKNKYSLLLDLYKSISIYGPSRAQDEKYSERYQISFTPREFFSKLYIKTQLEEDLYNAVDDIANGNIIALCGPAGSGKSTVSHKVVQSLENQIRTKLVFLDLRIEESSKTYDGIEQIDDEHIRKLLLRQFEKDFPILINENNQSERAFLYYYLLSAEPEIIEYKTAQVFLPLQHLINKTARLYNQVSPRLHIPFKDWFFDNYNHSDLVSIFNELDPLVDLPHYVAYLRYIDRYDRIIFWLDNIDAFPNLQQTQIVEVLEKLQRNILNSTRIIIAVREENIYRIGDFSDNFNEPFISKVTFKDPENNTTFTNYGAINVPVMSSESISLLIDRKLEFAFEKYLIYGRNLKSKLDKHDIEMADLKKSSVHIFNIKREDLYRQRNKILDKLNDYETNKISSQEFEVVKKIADKINDAFRNEKIIFLANNSLRNYLKIHSEFLDFIINRQIEAKGSIRADEYSLSQVTTFFLSWIHSVNDFFGIETFNIIEELGRFQTAIQENIVGCFLPYIVLTRIWNECIHLNGKPSPENNPHVYHVVKDIAKELKYSEEDIKKTIYELYRQAGGKGSFITFRTKKKIEGPEDLDLKTTVRITYRGRVTLGHITNSYGYLRECSQRILTVGDDEVDAEKIVLERIAQICEIHLTALLYIRDNCFNRHKNWYTHYLRRYGIPLKSAFVRNPNIGKKLDNTPYNRCLYLESVFDSLSSYYNLPNNYKDSLRILSGNFFQILDRIIGNEDINEIKISLQ